MELKALLLGILCPSYIKPQSNLNQTSIKPSTTVRCRGGVAIHGQAPQLPDQLIDDLRQALRDRCTTQIFVGTVVELF